MTTNFAILKIGRNTVKMVSSSWKYCVTLNCVHTRSFNCGYSSSNLSMFIFSARSFSDSAFSASSLRARGSFFSFWSGFAAVYPLHALIPSWILYLALLGTFLTFEILVIRWSDFLTSKKARNLCYWMGTLNVSPSAETTHLKTVDLLHPLCGCIMHNATIYAFF